MTLTLGLVGVVVVGAVVVVAVVAAVRRSARSRSPRSGRTDAGRRPARPSAVGRAAAPVAGTDERGRPAVTDWADRPPTLVAFLTAECGTCQQFWSAFARSGRSGPDPDDPAVLVVTPSPSTESRRAVAARVGAHGPAVVMSTEAWLDLDVRGAPWFVVVDGGAVVAEGTAASPAGLQPIVGGRLRY